MERRDKNDNGLISWAARPYEQMSKQGRSLARQLTLPIFAVVCAGFAISSPLLAMTAPTAERAAVAAVKFNTSFIQGTDQPADLQTFLEGNSVVPGSYRVDVYVNRALTGRRDITFVAQEKNGSVQPCLTIDMLAQFGMDTTLLKVPPAQSSACFDLPAQVEFAKVEYLRASLRLNISIPQAAMTRSSRGYVSPELWNEGEMVGFVNYSFSGARRSVSGQTRDQYYLGLRNGLNMGAWRLRNESSLVYGDGQPYRLNSNRTFVQRDITRLKSQLTIGQTYTDSQVFDSVRFVGATLMSDDGMLPDSERVYAPTVRGIADTNATVEVRQNGFRLYRGNVSPGPFEISDIYPSGSGGDLEVTVTEADGRQRVFIQAYSALPVMVPKGALRYSVAAGSYDSNEGGGESPGFSSAALIYGLTDRVTGMGGLQWAQGFQAGNLGAGLNTGLGAVSLDLTQSVSQQSRRNVTGQSVRVRYANTLDLTGTTLAVAGYRYSTDRYRTFDEHVQAMRDSTGLAAVGRAKDRLELNLTQALPQLLGSFSLTGSEQRYWGMAARTRQLFLSWNASWQSLSYSLSLESNQTSGQGSNSTSDQRIALTLSLPLGERSGAPRASFNTLRDSSGDYMAQAGLNGQFFDDRNTFYSLQSGYENRSGSSGFGKLSTATRAGRFDAGYGQGNDYRSLSLGASGSVVAHAGGINLGQTVGETFALIQVKGVPGAKLTNSNVETGSNGYAVLPYVQPYRSNWINLDTRQLGADVELDNAVQQVVPRRGAAPLVSFKVSTGRRVQFELVRPDGSGLPLGATVEDEHGRLLSSVDPTSRALVLSEQETGTLYVKWSDQHCQIPFRLPAKDPARAYEQIKAVCQ
jgi:outer membrane usher protein